MATDIDRPVYIDARVTCERCLHRLQGQTYDILYTHYDCGALLRPELGHAFVATRTGRTALCIVPRRGERPEED